MPESRLHRQYDREGNIIAEWREDESQHREDRRNLARNLKLYRDAVRANPDDVNARRTKIALADLIELFLELHGA